jgi:hypothetical protein
MNELVNGLKGPFNRRTFVKNGLAAAGAATVLANSPSLLAQQGPAEHSGRLTPGDAAILRFLAAAEIIETDLWQQYNELGGIQDSEVPGGSGSPAYTAALAVLDEDMDQYIHDNTEDELTHEVFINAYLTSKGASPVSLEEFRTLPSSKATGAQQIGRLTNLMQLTVDTSWWTRYRSRTKNPDFGDTFDQAVPSLAIGQHPAIPRTDDDLTPNDHIQAIANTAGFHFGTIEQGGTSLYPSLAQRVNHPEVLRILLSIGPTEAMHFQTWADKAGNAPAITDPTDPSLVFSEQKTSSVLNRATYRHKRRRNRSCEVPGCYGIVYRTIACILRIYAGSRRRRGQGQKQRPLTRTKKRGSTLSRCYGAAAFLVGVLLIFWNLGIDLIRPRKNSAGHTADLCEPSLLQDLSSLQTSDSAFAVSHDLALCVELGGTLS